MSVSINAAKGSGKSSECVLKHFDYIVIELFIERFYVHGEQSTPCFGWKRITLRFQKIEVGDRFRIVILQSVGIQADETHITGCKAEVWVTEHTVEHLFSRAQAIVIADETDVGRCSIALRVRSKSRLYS